MLKVFQQGESPALLPQIDGQSETVADEKHKPGSVPCTQYHLDRQQRRKRDPIDRYTTTKRKERRVFMHLCATDSIGYLISCQGSEEINFSHMWKLDKEKKR